MKPRELLTRAYLTEHYIRQGKTFKQIADELRIKSVSSVKQAAKRHRIASRPGGFNEAARVNSRNTNWRGCGEISGRYLCSLRARAKGRDIVCSVTPEYIWALFLQQNRRCRLSGVVLRFAGKATNEGMSEQTASLDRIDSTRGYVPGNVQWVHKTLNTMKMDMTDAEFVSWCDMVSSHRKGA